MRRKFESAAYGGRRRRRAGTVLAVLSVASCGEVTTSTPTSPRGPSARELRCTQEFGAPEESDYILPYRVDATYRLIQGYCPSNPAWGHHGWLAYDFDTAIGDTVVASRGGTVLFVEESHADGTRDCSENNWVWIEHDDGSVMQYVHLTRDGALVDVDDVIEQGQPIGLSGDSGCSSGPHLHVALFRDRTNFDARNSVPLNYVNADGPLDSRKGLVQSAEYTALPWR